VFIEGENGFVVLISVGEEAVLTVLARKDARLGLIFLDMRRAVEELTRIV
jgi:predicted regulator of Ras-like GTPase activity (Roadblock/LC7/MglB family)